MKLDYSKEWFERSAEIEGNSSEVEGCADSTGSRLVPFRNCEGKVVWFEANLTLAQMMNAGVESIHLSSIRQPNPEDPKIYFSANDQGHRPADEANRV